MVNPMNQVSTVSSYTEVADEFETPEFIGVHEVEKWILTPYLILVGVAAVFLNGTILWTIFKYEVLREKALFLILGVQKMCDFATTFAYVPVAVRVLWIGDHGLVSLLGVLLAAVRLGISTFLPIHVLTLLSFERYVYICRPLRYVQWFSSRKVAAYLASLVLLVTGWIPYTAFHSYVETWQLSCSFETSWDNKQVTVCGLFLYVVLPIGVQLYCFGQIMLVVIRQRRRRVGHLPGQVTGGVGQGTHLLTTSSILKAVIGVARLCGIYWLTWFPAAIVVTAAKLKYQGEILSPSFQYIMRMAVLFVMTAIPIANPLVCLRSMTDLREKWMKMLGIKGKSQNGARGGSA